MTNHHAIPKRMKPIENVLVPVCYSCHRRIHNSAKCYDFHAGKTIPTRVKNEKWYKNTILRLEKRLNRQKQSLAQLHAITKESKLLLKSKKQEAYFDICELINNLNDDLQMDKENGEFGYKNEKEVVRAVKKYTMKVLHRKAVKWALLMSMGDKEEKKRNESH